MYNMFMCELKNMFILLRNFFTKVPLFRTFSRFLYKLVFFTTLEFLKGTAYINLFIYFCFK